MAANAVLERTIVVPFKEGVETNDCARSTILIWIVLLMQVPDTAALMHLNLYCLPHEAPLSHIPSPAAANRFPDGNCDWSFPLHAVGKNGGPYRAAVPTSPREWWKNIAANRQRNTSDWCIDEMNMSALIKIPRKKKKKKENYQLYSLIWDCFAYKIHLRQ